MVNSTNKRKTNNTKLSSIHELDNLYISMPDVDNKRRSLLSSIKDSLIMQEESEKIKELRARKSKVLNEIKKDLVSINSNYQKLKKLFPNVKSVISYTEKELKDLEGQVQSIKRNISSEKKEIIGEEIMINKLSDSKPIKKELIQPKNSLKSKQKKKLILFKLNRIKNNLSVIE